MGGSGSILDRHWRGMTARFELWDFSPIIVVVNWKEKKGLHCFRTRRGRMRPILKDQSDVIFL